MRNSCRVLNRNSFQISIIVFFIFLITFNDSIKISIISLPRGWKSRQCLSSTSQLLLVKKMIDGSFFFSMPLMLLLFFFCFSVCYSSSGEWPLACTRYFFHVMSVPEPQERPWTNRSSNLGKK